MKRGDEEKISLLMADTEHGKSRAQWMKNAAAQGLVLAERNLVVFYNEGISVERDHVDALRLFRLVPQKGDPIAKDFCSRTKEMGRPR